MTDETTKWKGVAMQTQTQRGYGNLAPAGRPAEGQVNVSDLLRGKESQAKAWRALPTADAVVTDQCVLWKQYWYEDGAGGETGSGDYRGRGTESHFEVEFADAQGRMVRCWTDGTPYLCSQVRRGDRVTVWYVPDDDVSRIRVPAVLAKGDTENGWSPYTKRRGEEMDEKDIPPAAPDSELWCEPGTFGDAASHSEWGAEYWRCMPVMCCARWLFGDSANPERYTESDLRRYSNDSGNRGRSGPGGFGCGGFAISAVCFLLSLLLVNKDRDYFWMFLVAGAVFLIATLAAEAHDYFGARRDAARRVPGIVERGRILRVDMPYFTYRDEDQAQGRVSGVVRVPLFSNDGETPKSDEDGSDVWLRYCGDGYMALVDYAGPDGPERRWAFGDPRCYESYLADGQGAPVAVGDGAVVQWGGRILTVWAEDSTSPTHDRQVPFHYPTLVHTPGA